MKKSASTLIIITLLFCVSIITKAQDDSGANVKAFNVKKGGTLKVNINAGDVRITTWDKNEVSVKITSDDKDDISNISSVLENNTVKITSQDHWGWSGDVTVYVSIPSEFNIEINTQSGDITQNGNLKGTATIFTAGGDITLADISGKTTLKSNGGDITTGNIGDDLTLSTNGGDVKTGSVSGKVNINTMGGNITVAKAGKDLNVNTMGGDISIGNIGGNAEVKTMGGGISVNIVSGGANLNTYGGDISLAGANGNVEATTYGGNINMKNISGSINLDTKSGDINLELNPSGNSDSKIRTMNGGIKIFLSSNVKATIIATVKYRGNWEYRDKKYGISSDFKPQTINNKGNEGVTNAVFILNGGGNKIELYTINGNIQIGSK